MSTRLHLAAAVAALAPACGGGTPPSVLIDDPVAVTIEAGHAAGSNVAAQAFSELSLAEPDVLIGKAAGIVGALHKGQIDVSLFAVQQITRDDIFQYANEEVVDHEEEHARLDDVIRSAGTPYLPSQAQVQLATEASAALASLRATPSDTFDFAYAELQVTMHAEAQIILDELANLVGTGDMGVYIADTRLMINDHLARASAILDTFYQP